LSGQGGSSRGRRGGGAAVALVARGFTRAGRKNEEGQEGAGACRAAIAKVHRLRLPEAPVVRKRKRAGNSGRDRLRARCITSEERAMAKGQKKSNKEARKPKAEQPKKQNASNPSTKGTVLDSRS
jgi:hypothetical protein